MSLSLKLISPTIEARNDDYPSYTHGSRKKRRRRTRQSHQSWCYGWSWWLWTFGFLFVFFVLIPLIFWWPFGGTNYPHHHHHHILTKDSTRRLPEECTVGEIFSKELGMCRPKLPYPQAWDRSIMKDEIPACDSFFNHACGKWIESHTNENRAFTYIRKENEKQVADIVKNPDTTGVYEFYQSCLNTMVRGKYIQETTNQRQFMMGKAKQHLVHHKDLPKAFAVMARYGFTIPFQVTIEDYPTKPELVPTFRFDGFVGLDENEAFVRQHFERVYGQTAQAQHKTSNMIKMSRALNFMKPDPIVSLAKYKTSGKLDEHTMTYKAFKDLTQNFDWDVFTKELSKLVGTRHVLDFADEQEVWAMDPKFFKWFDPLEYTMEEWSTYIEFSVLYHSDEFFPHLPEDAYFTKHGMTYKHTQSKLNKRVESSSVTEQDCVHASNYLLPGLLAKQFLKDQFPEGERVRSKVVEVVENIRERFVQLIEETEWMGNTTKTQAVEKLRAIVVRAVHPTHWAEEDFGEQMAHDRYLRNINIIREYRVKRNLDLWKSSHKGTLFDRDSISNFGGPLSTVNAWYSPITNTITIFPGILRPPFFHLEYVDASLYGSIGLVAAHELSHSMDDTGRLFDKDGSFVDWWTEESKEGFHKRALCIIKEYKSPDGCDTEHYGEQTLCEDIADIVGIKLAFEAFVRAQSAKGKKVSDDEKRLFFYTFAQNWCESFDAEHLCARAKDDVHAIAMYRVDQTLRQIDDFAKAFGCHKHTKMVHETPCVMYGQE